MATRHQQKLERKKKKRNEKRHEIKVARSAGLAAQMQRAVSAPIHECLMSIDLGTEGIGEVILTRKLPDRQIAMAFFRVDVFCLGVKDAFGRTMSSAEFESLKESLTEKGSQLKSIPAASARRLVEGAVAYASELGLHPHADYRKLTPIFGTVDPAEGSDLCEFGQGGKPFFVAGPFDTPDRCRRILATLEKSCGPDGFHYMLPAGTVSASGEKTFGVLTEEEFEMLENEFADDDDYADEDE